MGWFSKKKKSAVPRPMAPKPIRAIQDQQTLELPPRGSSETVIDPKDFKSAAGVGITPASTMYQMPETQTEEPVSPMSANEFGSQVAPKVEQPSVRPETIRPKSFDEPFFTDINIYKRVLGRVEGMESEVKSLSDINKKLAKSEFNEEKSFTGLKSSIKNIHDKLLSMDELLFKS